MVLKHVFTAAIGAMLLACGGPALAAGYQADEFLGLDLSKAVLSPKPLGPPAHFVPVQTRARIQDETQTDPQGSAAPTSTNSEAYAERAMRKPKIVHLRAKKPRGAGRTTLARRHGNPLDAQAFDTRIQVWPCRSGGICKWQRP